MFPPELVDRVVSEAGRVEQRHRLLPARVVVYDVLAMAPTDIDAAVRLWFSGTSGRNSPYAIWKPGATGPGRSSACCSLKPGTRSAHCAMPACPVGRHPC